jgi:hypothetical protein
MLRMLNENPLVHIYITTILRFVQGTETIEFNQNKEWKKEAIKTYFKLLSET